MTLLRWDSETDWNNAQSEQGVVHENYGDLAGASVLQLGYPTTMANLEALYHCHENSGPTVKDVVGGKDGTSEGGVTFNVNGPLNGSAISMDGDDDAVNLGDADLTAGNNEFSIFALVTSDEISTNGDNKNVDERNYVVNADYNGSDAIPYTLNVDTKETNTTGFGFYDGDWRTATLTTDISDGNWHLVGGTYTGSTIKIYLDGNVNATTDYSATRNFHNEDEYIGLYANDNAHYHGDISFVMFFGDSVTDQFVSDLWDVVNTSISPNGTLKTVKKTS